MEESTEAHMETDVSSTTEDVPETQEVTGSNGNVEMVIVVEKVREEEMNSDMQNETTQQPVVSEDSNEDPKSSEESSQMDTETETSPIESPIKIIEIAPSPSELELPQKVVNKNLELDSEIELSAVTQQTEDADSSIIDTLQTHNEDTLKSSQYSPKKIQKKAVESSPKKDEPPQVLPITEIKLSESAWATPIQESVSVEKLQMNGKVQSSDASNDSSCKNVTTALPIDITIERDISNDSQLEIHSLETNISEISDKEHNKSISRELKSLINSAKESKIISECTQLKSKTRKSRSALDTSLNSSADAEKLQGVRRHSNNSQKSSCSDKSEKVPVKRSMRSQNPEFVSKVKQFLNSVTGKGHKDSDDEDDEEAISPNKIKKDDNDSMTSPKIRRTEPTVFERPGKLRADPYCWRCHWVVEPSTEKGHIPMQCTVCPRTFHFKCLSTSERSKINNEKTWVCPECLIVLQAESSETRSQSLKKISLGMLCDLLKHALERMMDVNGVEPFLQPVDRAQFPDYDKYVVHPMDLSLMKSNIDEGLYGSTEAFLADAQWILHNSIIFNTLQSKLTGGARALVRSCRAELGEIEACAECYAAAHAHRATWFTDVCTAPHVLLWAKLKGFPYWPAKGMSVSSAGHVDVRFFGAHDRAWVPAKDCFLYSEKDPNNFRTKRQDIIDSMQEAEEHIRNISRKYGKFVYPPFKTQFDPARLNEQLKMMIPSYEGEVRELTKNKTSTSPATSKEKSRTNSKSSKGSYNDGEMSENEETHEGDNSTSVTSRKMADGAEIAREDDETNAEQKIEVIIDVDAPIKANEAPQTSTANETPTQSIRFNESSRKRRRSDLEEAVITIMETPPSSKRKRNDKHDKEKKKYQEQEPSSSKEDKKDTPDKHRNGPSEDRSDDNEGKDNEPSSTRPDPEKEKIQRVTPIRIALVQKDRRHNLRPSTIKDAMAKIISPNKDKDKDKDNDRTTPQRAKSSRAEKAEKYDKASEKTPKEEKLTKSEKRRNSRNNRSLTSTPKTEKLRRVSFEKRSDKTAETSSIKDKSIEITKEKPKDIPVTSQEKEPDTEKPKKDKPSTENLPKPTNGETKSVKDRLQFDDDTTLAVIARESRTVVISDSQSCLPTISCVRSLSTTAQNTGTTITKITTTAKAPEIIIESSSDSSTAVVTPTIIDSDKNTKDAASKLQKLRNDAEPMVGRVGVRAFARMTSIDKSPNKNDNVQVEIKAEPIDVDDADRHMEKMNLMNAFRLRPVNPPVNAPSTLREVRINKVLVTPLNAKKAATKSVEIRPKAKKTFPQPKKPEDGQLNSKNSMVYIPIQPPMTQAPVRPPRVVPASTCPPPSIKPVNAAISSVNSLVNTVTTPVMQVSSMVTSSSTGVTATTSVSGVAAPLGTVPAAVHTVPLMTSVNGQWMFSFQPVMSVGAIENSPSPPILNGVSERGGATIVPLAAHAPGAAPAVTLAPAPPALQPPLPKPPADTSAPGEPPRLQQRPISILLNPLDASTPIGTLPTPSTAGPVTAKLNQNAVKLTDFFRTLLEDSLEKLDEPASQLTALKLQLEQTKWKHQTEIKELKHNHELTVAEMRALFEKEKSRAVAEARRTAQVELDAAVRAAKLKQWCANCNQEARFYCCWNTSYCDYPCQRAHWAQHHNVCTQQKKDGSKSGEPPSQPPSRLQPQPDLMPVLQKNAQAPALTVGGKLAPSRVYTQDPNNPQKNAIIVSMVEDQSGNQTMKCVGTYKSPTQNISPIILNKQIMNSEENANKKVVSSGGYLIVGGGANNSAVVTAARQTHTIQYFS